MKRVKVARTPQTLRLPPRRRPVPTAPRLRTRRVPLVGYIAVLLVLPIAVILGARATGWWVTSGHTVPASAFGAGVGAGSQTGGTGESGAGAIAANPHDIKGSMTIQQILDAFPKVTEAEILRQFGAPAGTPASTQLKTLAREGNGFEVSDLREWLETRQGG